jgi:hypothetical protein
MIELISKGLVLENIKKKVVDNGHSGSIVHTFGKHHSSTAAQAEKLGLKYIGFGRYGDDKGKVTHIVKNKKLVAVAQKNDDVLKGAVKYDPSHVDKDLEAFSKKTKKLPHDKNEKNADLDRYYHDQNRFSAINSYLETREPAKQGDKKQPPTDKSMKKRVAALDRIISASRTDKNIVVYSGTKTPIKDSGSIFHTKGFRAASTKIENVSKASPDVLEIHIPAGKRVKTISDHEVLLPRNHHLRIVGDPVRTGKNNIWKAHIVSIK